MVPRAGHQNAPSCDRPGALQCVESHGERLNHRTDSVVQFRRKKMTLFGAGGDKLGEGSIGGRRGAGAAQHDGLPAEVRATAFAVVAEAASPRRIGRHPLPGRHPQHTLADLRDLSGELMTEDKGSVGHERPAPAMPVVVEVGSTDPGTADTEQDEAGSRVRARVALDAKISGSVEDGRGHRGLHGSGYLRQHITGV
jgi:hypothetical protein